MLRVAQPLEGDAAIEAIAGNGSPTSGGTWTGSATTITRRRKLRCIQSSANIGGACISASTKAKRELPITGFAIHPSLRPLAFASDKSFVEPQAPAPKPGNVTDWG